MKRHILKLCALLCIFSVLTPSVSVFADDELEYGMESAAMEIEPLEGDLEQDGEVLQDAYIDEDGMVAERSSEEFSDLDDSNELFEEYFYSLSENIESNDSDKRKNARRSALNDNEVIIYDILKKAIEKIANGEQTSTIIEIPTNLLKYEKTEFTAKEVGVSSFFKGAAVDMDAYARAVEKLPYSLSTVRRALLMDCPYELYWFDKEIGVYSIQGLNAEPDRVWLPENAVIKMKFTVSRDYADEPYIATDYEVDPHKTGAAKEAVAKAKSVVDKYASDYDYYKLDDYRQWICDQVKYDDKSAQNYDMPYGDPWQIVYVFDGDPDTNVVCEGYAKAFKYLCDQSVFKSKDIENNLVTGYMTGAYGAGGHMWNLVKMGSKTYMCDLTNCDIALGEAKEFFMAGATGSSNGDEFVLNLGQKKVIYEYDEVSKKLFSESERIVTNSSYDVNFCEHGCGFDDSYKCNICNKECQHEKVKTDSTIAATCTKEGSVGAKRCEVCGKIIDAGSKAPALGHDIKKIEAKAATCTEDGNIEYYSCSRCNTLFSKNDASVVIELKDTVVKKLEHDYSSGWIADGETHRHECARCKKKVDEGAHEAVWVVDVRPTDSVAGTRHQECSICGLHLTGMQVVESHSHKNFLEKTAANKATCLANGNIEYYTCSECGMLFKDSNASYEISSKDIVILKGAHVYGDVWKSDAKGHYRECTLCKKVSDTQQHTLQWVIDKQPTTSSEGAKHEECKICKFKSGQEQSIPKVTPSENPVSGDVDNSNIVTEKEKEKEKDKDSTENKETKEDNAKPINSDQGVIDNGNTPKKDDPQMPVVKKELAIGKKFAEKNIKYTVVGSKEVVVTGSKVKDITSLTIPNSISHDDINYKIVGIAKRAFKNYSMLKKVKVGDNVRSIENSAFFGCKKLKKITLGTNLVSLGKHVFCHIGKNSTININSTKLKIVNGPIYHGAKNMVIRVPYNKYKAYRKLITGGKDKKNLEIIGI